MMRPLDRQRFRGASARTPLAFLSPHNRPVKRDSWRQGRNRSPAGSAPLQPAERVQMLHPKGPLPQRRNRILRWCDDGPTFLRCANPSLGLLFGNLRTGDLDRTRAGHRGRPNRRGLEQEIGVHPERGQAFRDVEPEATPAISLPHNRTHAVDDPRVITTAESPEELSTITALIGPRVGSKRIPSNVEASTLNSLL